VEVEHRRTSRKGRAQEDEQTSRKTSTEEERMQRTGAGKEQLNDDRSIDFTVGCRSMYLLSKLEWIERLAEKKEGERLEEFGSG
jgi:hypothetical protein